MGHWYTGSVSCELELNRYIYTMPLNRPTVFVTRTTWGRGGGQNNSTV